ncbi:MAG: sodium:solute symporter family protein [Deltaproteobacteria bacterium]|nr:MAG: sodium:solute symporter family protein [Deltaproteobacteria bacterium]
MDPLLYQYGLGGIVFVFGLIIAWRQGYVSLRGRGLVWLLALIGGLLFFAGLQSWLQYAPMTEATPKPFTGERPTKDMLGTPLDYGVMIGYFLAILAIGTWFGRNQKDTRDFFFGGQRFSWWLLAFSLIATTIGSYSFVKYSSISWNHGIASTQTYLNDWFWLPLLLFGWLPLLYFSRLTSIPEYFEHRFNPLARRVVTGLLLVYLVGYIGVNLFTMGKALHILLGWPVFTAAVVVATISAIYVTFGGQTSVIMTDLFQGVMLLAAGLLILGLAAVQLGGVVDLWEHLPRSHRMAFPHFNEDPAYPAVGIFWQDAIANSAMFYFLNQGILMRFMAARSVNEGRKAAVAVLIVLMPIAAIVVASGGWAGRALATAGILPADMDGGEVFFVTAELLASPGIFGLIMAALTAALMSTVDTLITAIAAIVVNDIYRPLRPGASEASQLRVARFTSIGVTIIGVALVPVFSMFDTIYEAHGAFTAAITPPMVVALLMGVFWKRTTPVAAVATMVGGTLAIAASIVWPWLITPFAHGVPMVEVGDGWLEGAKVYKFMRAFFGLAVSAAIGVSLTLITQPRSLDSIRGYVWGTMSDALARYKGSAGEELESAFVPARPVAVDHEAFRGEAQLPEARISSALADRIHAGEGDLLYVSDRRFWLGGLRSAHVVVAGVDEGDEPTVTLGPRARSAIGEGQPLLAVQRLY